MAAKKASAAAAAATGKKKSAKQSTATNTSKQQRKQEQKNEKLQVKRTRSDSDDDGDEERHNGARDDNDEEMFIKANEFLVNDSLNDQERRRHADNDEQEADRDEMLCDKLKAIDRKSSGGANSKRLRTEVVDGELDVNITKAIASTNANASSSSVYKIKPYELLHSLQKRVAATASSSSSSATTEATTAESATTGVAADTLALKKLFAKTHKRTKVLETPLPKHVTERAQRIAAYIEDKRDVSQWDSTVNKNRRVG